MVFSEQLSNESWITSYKRLVSTSSIASLQRRIILFALFEKSVNKMERFSIFFSLCFLAILVGSTPTDSSTETSRSNGYDARNVIEKPHAGILKSKSLKNDSECSLVNQSDIKSAAQLGEQSALYLNKISNASTIPTVSFLDNYTKDVQYIKQIENREDNTSPSNHKNRSDGDLSSHDILPGIILARLTRQVERNNMVSSNPSSVSAKSVESENIGSSQERSNFKSDLGVAEDRYRFQYPYWYRGQFANQRYRANDRREPYRNYLKYPVFPGK